MIIVEGCDNTGKTTLVRELVGSFSLDPHVKRMGPPSDYREFMSSLFGSLMRDPSQTIREIHDRFYFSELVYGKVIRGDCFIGPHEKKVVELIMREHDPLVIYCFLDPDAILKTFDQRDQFPEASQVKDVVSEYNRVLRDWSAAGGRLVIYDYRNPLSVEKAKQEVASYLFKRENQTKNNQTVSVSGFIPARS